MSYTGSFTRRAAMASLAMIAAACASAGRPEIPSEDRGQIQSSGRGMEELFAGRFPGDDLPSYVERDLLVERHGRSRIDGQSFSGRFWGGQILGVHIDIVNMYEGSSWPQPARNYFRDRFVVMMTTPFAPSDP